MPSLNYTDHKSVVEKMCNYGIKLLNNKPKKATLYIIQRGLIASDFYKLFNTLETALFSGLYNASTLSSLFCCEDNIEDKLNIIGNTLKDISKKFGRNLYHHTIHCNRNEEIIYVLYKTGLYLFRYNIILSFNDKDDKKFLLGVFPSECYKVYNIKK